MINFTFIMALKILQILFRTDKPDKNQLAEICFFLFLSVKNYNNNHAGQYSR